MKTKILHLALFAFFLSFSSIHSQDISEESHLDSDYIQHRQADLQRQSQNLDIEATNTTSNRKLQSANMMSYQAVARDAGGELMTNANVAIEFIIHEGAAAGPIVFSETQNLITDDDGVFSAQIGAINPLAINWGANTHFLEVTLNGTSVGTTEFVSVPYAKSADSMPLEASVGEGLIDADGLTITADNNIFHGEVMDIRATAPVTSSNDILNLDMPAGSSVNAQFIEARLDGTAVFQVQGDGRVLINTTTTAPQLNTVYGNSVPIAYASVSAGGVISTGYGVTSVTNSAVGVYDVVLDLPTNPDNTVVSITPFTASIGVPEICGYNPTGANTFTVFVQTVAGAGRSTAFSFVVYGN